jgi:hypothetical protein
MTKGPVPHDPYVVPRAEPFPVRHRLMQQPAAPPI